MNLNLPEAFATSDPIVTSTGVKLDFDHEGAKSATKYAKSKGQKNLSVAFATFPDGQNFYVIIQGSEVLYESQSFEEVGFFIDKQDLIKRYFGK
jgi:hypothetical protein